MQETQSDQWYGVRAIYLFGKKKDGMNVFEERVVAFAAKTFEEALSKAKREADEYGRTLKLEHRRRRHFTLVELVVVVAIMSVIWIVLWCV